MPRDPYEVLGVPRTATADQIREAHRKLAKKFHPDLNKTAEAAAKFKEVQEAYDLLSDDAKRRQFDQFGHAGPGMGGGSGGAGFGGAGGWGNVDPSTFEEIFGDFMGGGRRGGARRGPRAGEDLESDITVDFMTAALGGVRHVSVENGDGSSGLDVRIPAGIESGGQLRLRDAARAALELHLGHGDHFDHQLIGGARVLGDHLDCALRLGGLHAFEDNVGRRRRQ